MGDLTRDEFIAHMNLIRGDVKGVHDRLDDLNGRTRQNETAIAVLKDRSDESENGTKRTAAWAGGIGGALFAAFEAIKWWVSKP